MLDAARECCPSLPDPLVQHLLHVEYQILERVAWVDGHAPPALYHQKYLVDGGRRNDQQEEEAGGSTGSGGGGGSGGSGGSNGEGSSGATAFAGGTAEKGFSPTVQMFLTKLRTLAAIRIGGICRLFDGVLDDEVRDPSLPLPAVTND